MKDYLLTTNIEGKYVVKTLMGFNTLVKPSEVKNIISDLKDYCKEYSDEEIELINSNTVTHFFDSPISRKEYKRKEQSGYVYLLKCSNFYKIGYSKCVEQRIRQLDVRPFKIELLMKWQSDVAYDVEQALHEIYKPYRVDNEWYSSELPIETIVKTMKELEAEL